MEASGHGVETRSFVNTGFKTEGPKLLVPSRFFIANDINLDIRERGKPVEYGAAGEPIAMYVLQGACLVSLAEPAKSKEPVREDLAASPVEREVIISDTLAEALGIVILSPGRGHWRLVGDP